ncbi:MAG: amidohydrolase [Nitrososphaerota archaeon]|nr:amidohydrolase [Nitrososphaerota archaeon]
MKTVIRNAILVSFVGEALIQKRGSIFVDNSIIAKVGELDQETRASSADMVIDGKDIILTPGFVNLHTHAGPTAIRGIAEDMPLTKWLETYVNPAHRVLRKEDAMTDYRLAYLEMLKSGITHALDMYRFPEVGVREANELGIRATLVPYTADVYDYFEGPDDTVRNVRMFSNTKGLGRVWVGFEHISYCTESCLELLSNAALEYKTGIHTHEFETLDFVENAVKKYGKRPLDVFKQFNMLNHKLILAHCVWPTPEELRVMAEAGVSIAHNPTSNMKLASGVAPVAEMIRLGINAGLGTDGVKENNRLDIFQEMKNASLIQRAITGNASLMKAAEVFKIATVNGNAALGIKAGQLREGYLADLVLIDATAPNINPLYLENSVSAVVYSAHPGNIIAVMVNGNMVVENGKHVHIDETSVIKNAREAGEALLKRIEKS